MADPAGLTSAVKAIRAASSKLKLTTELQNSIKQLNPISKFLKNRTISPETQQQLGSFLRQGLLPLYNTFPILGAQYAVAVLVAIDEIKLVPSLNPKIGKMWETVQTSLLSGVLDFLEQFPSAENRSVIASSFYPVLRSVFFNSGVSQNLRVGTNPLHILCQLLSETVTSQPANQAELRKQDVFGSTNIGRILLSKDILVIEALLELFVKLLPSRKDSVDARIRFVQDVFDSAKLGCGTAVMKILDEKRPTTSDWDPVFSEIIELLGQTDLTFPQPFKISNFYLQASQNYVVERLYVDQFNFVANINQGSQIETFHAPCTSVQNITVGNVNENKTRVAILFSPPPFVGELAVASQPDAAIPVAFDIDSGEVTRFSLALKSRAINIAQARRKLSKAEVSLKLDYESKKIRATTQDKQRDLARLWDLNNSQPQLGQAVPTSPLMSMKASDAQTPRKGHPPLPGIKLPVFKKPVIAKTSSPEYDSIFGTTDEELTELSDIESKAPTRRPSRNKKQRPSDNARAKSFDSDDGSFIPRTAKSRRKTVVLSDEDTDSVKSHSQQPSIAGHSSPSSSMAVTVASVKRRPSSNLTQSGVSQPVGDQTSDSSQDKPKPSRKRKSAEDNVPDDSVNAIPPSKRLRSSPQPVKEMKSRRAPLPKRYGKRGRTSSPNLPSSPSIDVDSYELPEPSTTLAKVDHGKPSRVSGMKDKGGNRAAKTTTTDQSKLEPVDEAASKVVPAKKTQKKGRATTKTQTSVKESSGKPKVEAKSSPNLKPEPQRRSARGAKVSIESVEPAHVAELASATNSNEDGKKKAIRPRKKTQTTRKKDANIGATEPAINEENENAIVNPLENAVLDHHESINAENAALASPKIGNNVEIEMRTGSNGASVNPPKEPQQAPRQDVSPQGLASTTTNIAPGIKETIENILHDMLSRQQSQLANTEVTNLPHSTAAVPEIARIARASTHVQCVNEEMETDDDQMLMDATDQKVVPQHLIKNLPKRSFIDLALNSPLPLTTADAVPKKSVLKNKPSMLLQTSKNDLDLSLSTASAASPPSPVQLPTSKLYRPRVSFAPSASFVDQPAYDLSLEFEPHVSEPASPLQKNAAKILHKNLRQNYSKKKQEEYLPQTRKHDINSTYNPSGHFSEDEYLVTKKRNADPMLKIIGILDEIHNAMKSKVSYRFEKVSKDLRAGERSILRETAQHLQVTLFESAQHSDNFVDLETQYATHHRKIVDSLNDVSDSEEKLITFLGTTIQEHSRYSLSRKFSTTFFNSPLPSILSNPKLLL